MAQVNATIKFYGYISAAWVELDDAAGAAGARFFWGIPGNGPLDRIADTADLRLPLNNATGLYTIGGPSMLAGWRKGIPIKMVITFENEDHDYLYYLDDVDARPSNKDKLAYAYCVDWLDYAERSPIVNPGVQTNKRGDEVLTTAIGLVAIAPPGGTNFDTGRETFPTAFDTVTSHTTVLKEAMKVAYSEIGHVYLKHNGVLVFENADSRHGWRAAGEIPLESASSGLFLKEDGGYLLKEDGGKIILNQTAAQTFDGSIIDDFEAPYGDHQINRMTVLAYPRRLGASPEVLFELDEEIVLGPGKTYTLKGYWADPDGGLPINAQDHIEPDPSTATDCSAFTTTGGGGSNITSSLVLNSWSPGTEGFSVDLYNGNASTMYIYTFAPRATAIRRPNPTEHVATNSASITEFEANSETLNQKYKNDLYAGRVFVDSQVEEHKEPRTVLNSIPFTANKSPSAMMAFLYTEIGDLRYIEIDELGLTGNCYIQGIEVEMKGNIIKVTWRVVLALSLIAGFSPLAIEFAGGSATDGINFGFVPHISNLRQRSISAWIYLDTDVPDSTYYTIAGYNVNYLFVVKQNRKIKLYDQQMGVAGAGGGDWTSTDSNVIPLGEWVHVVVTHDTTAWPSNSVPIIYVNGVTVALTEGTTPSGNFGTENGMDFTIGNVHSNNNDYADAFDGKIADVRVYDSVLTAANVAIIYNSGRPDETLVTDGLVFQAFAVRDEDLADFVDETLTTAQKVFDNIFKVVGEVHGAPIGRAAP